MRNEVNEEFQYKQCRKDIHTDCYFFPFAGEGVENDVTQVSHDNSIGNAIT